MQSQINYTRITLPSQPAGIIKRDELILKLNENSDKKLILLNAPAGYGKSTLINYFLRSQKKDYGWIRLQQDIDSSYILLLYIIEAIKKINNDFGKETLQTLELLGNDPKKIISQEPALLSIINTFSNEFSAVFNSDITIVLDDIHELSQQIWIKKFIDLLLNETPDNLRIIITTRFLAEINISSLKAKRKILEITQNELALSPEEFSELAKKLYNIKYSAEDSLNLVKYMGGWVTGIHLLLQVSEPGNILSFAGKSVLPENLFEFFAAEVYSKLDETVQDFLLKTSLVVEYDIEFCNELLNISNSGEIIELLAGRNIFIESIRSFDSDTHHQVKFTYNRLFRDFLRQKAMEMPENILADIYNKIALLYLAKNQPGTAFEYFILAKEYKKAFDQLQIFFNDYFNQSNFEKLWQCISAFKTDFTDNNKLLLYYKGILLKFYKGEIDQALNCFNAALMLNDKDLNFKILCTQAKAGILLTLGKGRINEAIEILNDILINEPNRLENAKTYHLLGNSYFNINKPEISETYLEKALQICNEHPDGELEHDVYSMLGNIKITNGDFIQSHHYYELALNKTNGLFKKIVILGNLTVLYSRSGKFSKAAEFLQKSKELLNKFKTPIFEIIVKMTEYSLLFETGDYAAGITLAEEIKELALRSNNSNFIFLSYQFLGECSYYSGNPAKSIEFYKLAGRFIDESNESDEILLSLLIVISELQLNLNTEIETKLLRAYTFLDAVNSNYDKTIAGYYLAKYYFNSGQPLTALKYFVKSVEQASIHEYRSFLLREYMFQDSIFNLPEHDSEIKSIVEAIRGSISDLSELPWISGNHKKSLNDLIQRSYDLKMKIFGGLEFIVKNEPVKESEWKRKKRKLILCYLILNSGKNISKDKIVDLFFGESSAENSDNLFHQAISNIRTALKTAYSASEPASESGTFADKQLIVYEGKQLKIAKGISVYSDASVFERLIQNASASENIKDKIVFYKEAVELYTGDALEGFYEPWCEEVRSEYRTKYIKLLENYSKLLFEEAMYDDAVIYSELLIKKEPLNEYGIEILIGSLLKSGKINLAKEKFEEFKRNYKDELNENIPPELEKRILSMYK